MRRLFQAGFGPFVRLNILALKNFKSKIKNFILLLRMDNVQMQGAEIK